MNKHVTESEIQRRPITVMVTLEQLRHGSEYPGGGVNSRKVYRDQDIQHLAYSLLPQNDGQLKPLLCCTHKSSPGLFFVFDGGRREASFDHAIKKAMLPKDHPIEIKDYGQITPELALQLSWAANEQVPLHPADRAEAFAKLSASKTAEQIADERGMSLQAVKQSIAMGTALAPDAIQLWRENLIARDDVEVLVLGDIEQQQAVLKDFRGSWDCTHGKGLNKSEVRRKLMNGKEPEMRRLLGFVGVGNYRAAGGVVVEDFFGQGGNVKDMKLLKRLAKDAMEMIRRDLEGEGWSWVEMLLTSALGHHGYSEIAAKPKFTGEESKRIATIAAALKKLEDDENDEIPDASEQEERLTYEKELIESRALLRAYDAKQRAKAGVLVSLTPSGDVIYEPGLVRKAEAKPSATAKSKVPAAPPAPRAPDVDGSVEESLDEIQRAAVRTLIVGRPREAFALFLAAATQGMYGCISWEDIGDGDEIGKGRTLAAVFGELKSLSLEKLAGRLSAAMGRVVSLDGSTDAQVVVQLLGEKALQAEFAKGFDPKTYAAGASRLHLLGIIADTLGASARKEHEKDGEAALKLPAIEGIKKTGWLPPALRTKAYAAAKPAPTKAAAPVKKKPVKKKAGKK